MLLYSLVTLLKIFKLRIRDMRNIEKLPTPPNPPTPPPWTLLLLSPPWRPPSPGSTYFSICSKYR